MPEITEAESLRQCDELWQAFVAAQRAQDFEGALDALGQLLAHPCAHHRATDAEVHEEIHLALRRVGRWDEAILAKRKAIAAGYRSSPDPEADIAETLVEAGRRDEADALYADLKARTPDDVWLYNSAGYIYAGVDDWEALRWLLEGIEVALTSGDPDRVIDQLLEMTRERWDALDEPHDAELIARAEAFRAAWVRPLKAQSWGSEAPPPALDSPCDHCGYRPEPSLPPTFDAPSAPRAPGRSERLELALAWFPADEWGIATTRWPDLLNELPADHLAYSHRIEARAKFMRRRMPGQALAISPLGVAELDESGPREGNDPGSGAARSHLAAEMARTDRSLPWPPGRNEPCWCRSGARYKKCCGPVPSAED